MSIFPATDIVSDVARAADPQKAQAAFARLSSMATARIDAVAPKQFSLDATMRLSSSVTETKPIANEPAAGQSQALSVTQKFEAFLMQNWLETLLPKEGSGIYGSDPGANIWRSMMAEQLGTKLASVDCLGLHKFLDFKNGVQTRS